MIEQALTPAPRKDRKPVERSLMFTPAKPNTDAVLGLFVGKLAVFYVVTAIPTEIGGKAFQLDKLHATEPEVYHILLTEDGYARCDCMGAERWGRCKHGDAIKQLDAAGQLPEPGTAIPPGFDEIALRHHEHRPSVAEVAENWARGLHDAGLEHVPIEAESLRAA